MAGWTNEGDRQATAADAHLDGSDIANSFAGTRKVVN